MSSKKSTTTQQSTSSSTSTPNVPSWIANPTENLSNMESSLAANGYGAYSPQTSALQEQTFGEAMGYQPTSNYSDAQAAYSGVNPITTNPNSFANATSAYSNIPQVQAQSLLTNLSDYYNPYESGVINPAIAALSNQQQQQAAQQQAAAAAGQAFQGSRYGVEQGVTAGQNTLAQGQLVSGYLNDMYNTATSLSAQDAAARQSAQNANQQAALAAAGGLAGIDTTQAAQSLQAQQATAQNQLAKAAGLAGIDTSANANQLAALNLQNQIGQQMTSAQQMQEQYPITFAAQMEGLLSGLNPGLYTGQSSTGTSNSKGTQVVSDPMGQITGLIGAGSSLFKGFGA